MLRSVISRNSRTQLSQKAVARAGTCILSPYNFSCLFKFIKAMEKKHFFFQQSYGISEIHQMCFISCISFTVSVVGFFSFTPDSLFFLFFQTFAKLPVRIEIFVRKSQKNLYTLSSLLEWASLRNFPVAFSHSGWRKAAIFLQSCSYPWGSSSGKEQHVSAILLIWRRSTSLLHKNNLFP